MTNIRKGVDTVNMFKWRQEFKNIYHLHLFVWLCDKCSSSTPHFHASFHWHVMGHCHHLSLRRSFDREPLNCLLVRFDEKIQMTQNNSVRVQKRPQHTDGRVRFSFLQIERLLREDLIFFLPRPPTPHLPLAVGKLEVSVEVPRRKHPEIHVEGEGQKKTFCWSEKQKNQHFMFVVFHFYIHQKVVTVIFFLSLFMPDRRLCCHFRRSCCYCWTAIKWGSWQAFYGAYCKGWNAAWTTKPASENFSKYQAGGENVHIFLYHLWKNNKSQLLNT